MVFIWDHTTQYSGNCHDPIGCFADEPLVLPIFFNYGPTEADLSMFENKYVKIGKLMINPVDLGVTQSSYLQEETPSLLFFLG